MKEDKYKHVSDYDYQGRYDGHYHDGDYYERCSNCDEGSRFTLRLDISEFEGRMHADDFLDWLNMVECIFEYVTLLRTKGGSWRLLTCARILLFGGKIEEAA